MNSIHIKKSKQGSLRKAMHAPEGKKLSVSAMQSKKKNASPAMKKKLTFALNAKKWKHEDGGLVQYGWGGSIASAGAVASMIPTPWTQIGGAALSMIGGIVGGQEEKKLQEEQLAKQAQASADIGQAGIRNPYQATFADGGVVDGPTFGKGTSSTVVTNNLWTPQTRSSIYPLLAQKGLLGQGADSLTMQQWNQLTPQQTTSYMGKDQGFDWTQGHTANPGGIKYWNLDKVPAVNGKSIRSSKFGDAYINEKAKTKYATGGIIPGPYSNIDVEGGEVLQGNDGSAVEVNGPKHAQGGIPLMMENGGRVFSDKIINPDTGNTFAEDANRLRKMIK